MFFYLEIPIKIFSGINGKIAGKVTDSESGAAMSAANIYIEGTTLGADSDINGD